MPLPESSARELIHRRTIHCDGYRREDGLWDIEARMCDVKTITLDVAERGDLPAGEALHDLSLRLTIDGLMTIQKVEACIDASPFRSCPNIADAFKCLEGLSIGRGWRTQAAERLGGVLGCTHLNELLPVLATTAFQALWPGHKASRNSGMAGVVVNTCHSWSQHGEVVKRYLPEFYVPE